MTTFYKFTRQKQLIDSLSAQTGWPRERVLQAVVNARLRLRSPAVTLPQPRPTALGRSVPDAVSVATNLPTRSVRIRLPSGRTLRVRMPGVARQRDLNAVKRTTLLNAKRQREALQAHANAIDELAAAHASIEARINEATERANLALVAAMREPAELQEALRALRADFAGQQRAFDELETGLSRSQQLQSQLGNARAVKDAVSSMQVAAYGEHGNVFAGPNLLLGGSELLWGSLDSWLRNAGLWAGAGPVPLSWLGPLLGLVVGHLTVGQKQLERFVSAELELTPVDPGEEFSAFVWRASVDLRSHIAAGSWNEFRQRTDIAARADVLGVPRSTASAMVAGGVLSVNAAVFDRVEAVRVIWTVDTRPNRG